MERAESLGGDAPGGAAAWYCEAKEADWETPADVKKRFPKADIVDAKTIIFDICGNKYRLVVRVFYKARIMWVKFFGTHAQYDRTDMKDLRHGKL